MPAGRQRKRVETNLEREEEERRQAGVNYDIQRWPALDRIRAPKRKKCAVLCCAVLCFAVLCCAVLCRAAPCRA